MVLTKFRFDAFSCARQGFGIQLLGINPFKDPAHPAPLESHNA